MAERLNVKIGPGRYMCPVCGDPDDTDDTDAPVYDATGRRKTELQFCPCCLWEPGYDDAPAASKDAEATVRESIIARADWRRSMAWLGRVKPPPEGFDANAQLARLRMAAPHYVLGGGGVGALSGSYVVAQTVVFGMRLRLLLD